MNLLSLNLMQVRTWLVKQSEGRNLEEHKLITVTMDREDQLPSWKQSTLNGLLDPGEEEALRPIKPSSLPLIPQPQTPNETMEFLSRSWSISAEEISKALTANNRHKHRFHLEKNPCTTIPEAASPPPSQLQVDKPSRNSTHNNNRMGAFRKWFHIHNRRQESSGLHGSINKKDRARAGNAHTHAAVSIAGLATALAAAVTAADSATGSSKMSAAVASATELLASHCIELAQQAGADPRHVASVVRSAVDITTPGHLVTLTAAAATALRGEATLRARLPKEAKRNAAISPYETNKTTKDNQYPDPFLNEVEDLVPSSCAGELLQRTRKGSLRRKHVAVCINKNSQVVIRLKSKHVGGGSLTKKNHKCIVYGVCDRTTTWPSKNEERDDNLEAYFGLKTAQGFLAFKCKDELQKQQWVEGIRSLLHHIGRVHDMENELQQLTVSNE